MVEAKAFDRNVSGKVNKKETFATTRASFDKQFVRDWLLTSGWDRDSTPPELPADVVAKTQERYNSAFTLLTGKAL